MIAIADAPLRPTVPISAPTPRIEALPGIASPGAQYARKPLETRNIAQRCATLVPTSKYLILRGLMVRDQEVGGPNPLAPTSPSDHFGGIPEVKYASGKAESKRGQWGDVG
jgi:hypothetical protein